MRTVEQASDKIKDLLQGVPTSTWVRGAPGARILNPRIKSSVVYRPEGSGRVLAWVCVLAWCPADSGELQPELQPRAGAPGGCGVRWRYELAGGVLAWGRMRLLWRVPAEGGPVVCGPGAGSALGCGHGRCTSSGARRTASAHFATPTVRAALRPPAGCCARLAGGSLPGARRAAR